MLEGKHSEEKVKATIESVAPYETEIKDEVTRAKVPENVEKVDELERHANVENSERHENRAKTMGQSRKKKDEL